MVQESKNVSCHLMLYMILKYPTTPAIFQTFKVAGYFQMKFLFIDFFLVWQKLLVTCYCVVTAARYWTPRTTALGTRALGTRYYGTGPQAPTTGHQLPGTEHQAPDTMFGSFSHKDHHHLMNTFMLLTCGGKQVCLCEILVSKILRQ